MKAKLQQSLAEQIQLMLNHSNCLMDPGAGRGITVMPPQLGVLTAVQGVGFGPFPLWMTVRGFIQAHRES